MEVILMSGLPGSGKDRYIKTHFKDYPIVSLDQIRAEKKVSPTDKTGNGQAIQAEKALLRLPPERPAIPPTRSA